MPKGQPRASVSTLLRMLAKDAKNEKVRLEAIRLLMIAEGKLPSDGHGPANRPQKARHSKEKTGPGLAALAEKMASESSANQG